MDQPLGLHNIPRKVAKGPTHETYGKVTERTNAQKAVPVAPPEQAPYQVQPGSLGAFNRPSERPNQPITAGADFGPGPSSLQAGIPMFSERGRAVQEVAAIAKMFPTEDLLDLLDKYGKDL